jgi:NADP-dependent 3-hydroxy acid dehydrogenase YdfG
MYPGLGAMMARAVDANGAARIFVVGRREELLKETAASAKNGEIVPPVGDVTSKQSLGKMADEVAKKFDHLDVLIRNSGASGPRLLSNKEDGHTPATIAEIRDFCGNVPMEKF